MKQALYFLTILSIVLLSCNNNKADSQTPFKDTIQFLGMTVTPDSSKFLPVRIMDGISFGAMQYDSSKKKWNFTTDSVVNVPMNGYYDTLNKRAVLDSCLTCIPQVVTFVQNTKLIVTKVGTAKEQREAFKYLEQFIKRPPSPPDAIFDATKKPN